MGWRKKRVLKTQQPAKSMTEFFVGHARNTEYVFSVTMIPRVENRVRKDGWIWEKYNLDDEEAMGFTEVIGRVLGREVRLPETFQLEPYRMERCLRVIPGGRSNG